MTVPRPVRSFARIGGAAAGLLLLAACATTDPRIAQWARKPAFHDPVELTSVPFFPQTRYECGPASLATVLNWTGRRVTPEQLVPKVYLPQRHGSLAIELVTATWREGRLPYVIPPHLDALLTEVAAGHPVLVLENLSFDWYPMWHYAVVVGFDLSRSAIVLRSGVEQRHVIPVSLFERLWARSHRWGLVVLRPGEIPPDAQPLRYLKAAYGLERAGDLQAAVRSYRAAARRWPEDLDATMAWGNGLYALGDTRGAAEAFRLAVSRHPDAGPALNNLAETLVSLGDYRTARTLAERAVAQGGPDQPVYARTLEQIERRLRASAPSRGSRRGSALRRSAALPPAHTP